MANSIKADLKAIEALNRQDTKAVIEGDIPTIISQWSDDFVVLPAIGPIVRGRSANIAIANRTREQIRANSADFEEIRVLGDYAYEWGTYRGKSRPRAGGATTCYGGKLMRVLRRQPDGTWKMHRTIATADPPGQ